MIWIQNPDHVIQDADRIRSGVDVLIDGDRIVRVGTVRPEEAAGADVIDGRGHIVMPGLVNTHTHLYQTMLRGMGDSLTLKPWCESVTFPFASVIHREERERPDPQLGYYWSALGAMEMVRAGITSFVDMDIVQDGVLRAWRELGVRGNLALQLVNRWVPKELMISDEQRKENALAIVDRWHGVDKLSVSMAPSTPFACTPDFLLWIRDAAERYGLETFIHIAETRWEVEQARQETGMSPFAYLDDIGFLDRPVHAVHCVWVDDADLAIMERRRLDVVYNPKSNAKLGSGIAPIPAYLERGIPVAVSTDGPASNDVHDMFEEMRFGQLLQKASACRPTALSVRDVFHMATAAGARMMGIDAGVVEEGKLADVVLLSTDNVHMQPVNDVLQSVFYCAKAADVDGVIIGGQEVMRAGNILTMDERRTLDEAVGLYQEAKQSIEKKLDAEF